MAPPSTNSKLPPCGAWYRASIERRQSGFVEQALAIGEQHVDRGLRGRIVELGDRRHPPLGELIGRPPADHAHPLALRRAFRLLGDHLQSALQQFHSVPAQLEIVVASAAHKVEMQIVEPGNDPSSSCGDQPGIVASEAHDLGFATDCDDLLAANRKSLRLGSAGLERRHPGIVHDQARRCLRSDRLGPAPRCRARDRDHRAAAACRQKTASGYHGRVLLNWCAADAARCS